MGYTTPTASSVRKTQYQQSEQTPVLSHASFSLQVIRNNKNIAACMFGLQEAIISNDH